MRILVDALPTEPWECGFMKELFVGEVETCPDCGGVIMEDEIDEEDIVCGCIITGESCSLYESGECDCLSVGYVTKF